MDLETLVAILAVGIPTINLIVPILNNIINFFLEERKSKIEFERNNKLNSLTNFLNSINDYSKEPTEINKNICYSNFIKLYCYYEISKEFDYDIFFSGKTDINFRELSDFVKSIKK